MIRVRINPQTCLFHEYFHSKICLTINFCGFRDEAKKNFFRINSLLSSA